MRKLTLILLLLLALPAWAQRAPVYDCWVIETGDADTGDGSGYVTLMVARDSLEVYKNRYPTPANGLDGVKSLCRAEIARLQSRDTRPIAKGKVDLTVPVVEPPPPPTPEEVARQVFLAKVERLQRLKAVLGPANPDVAALEAEVALELKAHPEYEDSL